jgi:hypothetical protein
MIFRRISKLGTLCWKLIFNAGSIHRKPESKFPVSDVSFWPPLDVIWVARFFSAWHTKTFQNLPKLGFLVWKYRIWQHLMWSRMKNELLRQSLANCHVTASSGKSASGANFIKNFFATQRCQTFVCRQRAILNFTPGPQGWISPLGVNLAPRGEICPLGVKFTPSFTPEHSLLFRIMEGQTENFTPRG